MAGGSHLPFFMLMSYNDKYKRDGLYWGSEPTTSCKLLVEKIPIKKDHNLSVLDIGTGEGRDALYLAKLGFEVTAFDLSPVGVDKLYLQAKDKNLKIETFVADIKDFQIDKKFDICLSTGTLHYLPPEIREQRIEYLKTLVEPGGFHVFSVFVEKPFIPKAPDAESNAYLFQSGELMSYYHDWEIIYTTEAIFDCNSSGTPHQHATNRIVAQKR